MPPRHHRRKSAIYQSHLIAPELCRLWMLRLLVPLDAQRKFIKSHGFDSDALAAVLGLGRWIEGDSESDSESGAVEPAGELDWEEESEEILKPDFNPKRVRTELRRLHRSAERHASSANLPAALSTNLDRLARLVGLNEVDVGLLSFAVMLRSDGLLVEAAARLGQISTVQLPRVLAVVLGLTEDQVRHSLAGQGVLARCGLVTCQRLGADHLPDKLELLSDYFADNILSNEMDPVDLLRENVAPCPAPELGLSDYTHIEPSLTLLQPYLLHALDQRRKGVNIFS